MNTNTNSYYREPLRPNPPTPYQLKHTSPYTPHIPFLPTVNSLFSWLCDLHLGIACLKRRLLTKKKWCGGSGERCVGVGRVCRSLGSRSLRSNTNIIIYYVNIIMKTISLKGLSPRSHYAATTRQPQQQPANRFSGCCVEGASRQPAVIPFFPLFLML